MHDQILCQCLVFVYVLFCFVLSWLFLCVFVSIIRFRTVTKSEQAVGSDRHALSLVQMYPQDTILERYDVHSIISITMYSKELSPFIRS